jgi:hypothetical protein
MTSKVHRISGACDKSLISRRVTRLAFSLERMASVDEQVSTVTVQISDAEFKRSLYSQVT